MKQRTPTSFTLVEIIVVTGILVTMILFLLTATLTSSKLTRDSSERAAARAVVYARLAQLRAQLRSADISGADESTKDAQFVDLLARDTRNGITPPADYTPITIGATTWVTEQIPDLFKTFNAAGQELNVEGYLTLVTFCDDPTAPTSCNEDLANAEFDTRGLATDDTIDIDADGDKDGTAVLIEDLQMVPVLIRVEWKPSTWQPGDPVSFYEVGGIIY